MLGYQLRHMFSATILLEAIICNSVRTDTVTVVTNNGPMVGVRTLYHTGQPVYQFKRIPYAKPPVGDLRFKSTVPYGNWTGTLDATQFGPSCTQYLNGNDKWLLPNTNISEDCLFLNIYAPRSLSHVQSGHRAVMVWIHGGSFTTGQGILFDGSYLALQGDVIVVTINYRLGFLGFLSTQDDNAVGNYGLLDQMLAIQWVKDNAKYFGGDPSNICVFGESAGGYSVGLLSIMPVNNGLFQKAISESGAIYSPWATADARQTAEKLGHLLNCSFTDTKQLVTCLKSISADDILSKQGPASSAPPGVLTFKNHLGPVVDGKLIPDDPITLLSNKSTAAYKMFASLDVMAGTNSAEGGLLYFLLKEFQDKWQFDINKGIPKRVLCDLVAPSVASDYYHGDANVSSAICKMYALDGADIEEQARSTAHIYADTQFIVPTVNTLLAHSAQSVAGASYHYLFSHQPSFTWIRTRPDWLIGANHAGEVPFVFGLDAMYPKTVTRPPEELNLSRQMMTYWSNFAKTSNPNGPDLPRWPQYDDTGRHFMNLTININVGSDLYEDRVRFWRERPPGNTKQHATNSAVGLSSNFILQLIISVFRV